MTAEFDPLISPSNPGKRGIITTTLNYSFLSWANFILSIKAFAILFLTLDPAELDIKN